MTNNTVERESLRTAFLDDLWLLKTTLSALPRHLDHSEEQFEAGFAAECQIRWLPLVQCLDAIAHQWQQLYPEFDITQRPSYTTITRLMNDLSVQGKLHPRTFKNELFKLASHFRTYDLCYFDKIDDDVIQEKLALIIKSLTLVADHYIEDHRNAVERVNQSTLCSELP